MIYVLYHNDKDGQGSAFAAWKKFGSVGVEYIPVNYNQPLPVMESSSDVYILDFTYPKHVLEQWSREMNCVFVVDHHKNAYEHLKDINQTPTFGITFDENKSGCVLSWEFFHPNSMPSTRSLT